MPEALDMLCLELGRLAAEPSQRVSRRPLRDRTPAPPPAHIRRRPEC